MAGSRLWCFVLVAVACAGAVWARPPASSGRVPPGFTMTRTGGVDDFAYFEGAWTTRQHRQVAKGKRRGQWDDFPGTLCMTRYLNGLATVDEIYFPQSGKSGLTLRTFDPAASQWSIYWVNSATGRLDPVPVVGGFLKGRGEFYANDRVDGRPVKVRYLWQLRDPDHARWEQAFSFDSRKWETNWSADFARADARATCQGGRPRR